MDLEGEEEISVQAAYTPESSCWGCGKTCCLTCSAHACSTVLPVSRSRNMQAHAASL